jgi:heme/copper-type cytochrome/quinol oxidase subunit 2
VMYALLPQITQPGQPAVPALPPNAADPTQTFLTIFIVMTAIGAPVTGGIVLVLIMRALAHRLPSSSAAADSTKPKAARPAKAAVSAAAPKELSPAEARFWKIAATLLSLALGGGLLALFWNDIVRLFS